MEQAVADLYVTLRSITDPFSNGLKRAAVDAESQSRRMGAALAAVTKVGLGVGLAVGGIAVASAKAASDFQTQMTRLYTAAGAPKAAVQAATGEILKLGTQVGMTGTQMAEALYHPVSAGLDLATSMQVVKYAAEEAQISGASLDNTTYSLSSVMKAFNLPASQAAQTMADLNAIVGQGDTHFQDFNVSIKNWAPTAAAMGISITSIGSAIGYLTDRGNSAEEASTRLTMGLSMMATPSHQAAKLLEGLGVASSDVKGSTDAMTEVLKKSGITQNQLALDLQKPDGIYVALTHLKTALNDAGVKGTEADSAIAKIFGGGRSDKAILSLMQDLGGLQDKFNKVTADSTTTKFNQNWDDTKSNFGFLMDQMKAGAENLGIELGLRLIPKLSGLVTLAEGAGSQIVSGFTGSASAVRPLAHDNMRNAFLNRDLATPPALTGWQEFGQKIHRYLTDIVQDVRKLAPIGQDLVRFGVDVYQGGVKLLSGLEPTAKLLGGAMLWGLQEVGHVLADQVGPAFKWFGDFIDSHKVLFEVFATSVLGTMALKMGALGAINAAKGLVDLATKIVQFPLQQVGEITTAIDGVKTAWTGKEAAKGEQAIQGLAGAFGDLKTKASGVLDKILPDSGRLAGLAQMSQSLDGVGVSAKAADEQLSLFATTEQGVVQLAGQEQLALFERDLSGVEMEAGKAATATEAAGAAAAGMGTKMLAALGPIALLGGALVGLGYAAQKTGMTADHTGQAADKLMQQLGASTGMAQGAIDKFGEMGAKLAIISNESAGGAGGVQEVDKALAGMVTSGHLDWAKARFDAIATSLKNDGMNSIDAASKFPAYEAALNNAGTAADTMAGKVQNSIDAMQHQQLLDQFNSDLANVTQTITANGNALSGNSAQAQQNIGAFRNLTLESLQLWKSQTDAHAPVDQVNHDLAQQYLALEGVATQFLGSKQKADDFLASLGMIKPEYDTSIGLSTDRAVKELNGLLQTINTSYGTVNVTVSTTGLGVSTARGAATPSLNADGGPVRGGELSWVGERGPELVVFGRDGYVIPNESLTGRQPIDPRILSGAGLRGGGSAAYVPGAGAGSMATTVVNNYIVNVAGSVLSQMELENVLRTQVLRTKNRNSNNLLG